MMINTRRQRSMLYSGPFRHSVC